jgi:hypothetical protein
MPLGYELLHSIAKLKYCHSERSEESRFFDRLRCFTPFG